MELKALLILYILGLFVIGKVAGKSKSIEELNLANGEIGWLSDFSKEEFTKMLARTNGYSKAQYIIRI